MVFKVELVDGPARGYVCENYGAKFTLPDRGPIGANCLANPRDFKTPVAWFEEKETPCRLIVKWCGSFHVTEIGHSPLDVVAWHGNYAPYKYDLATFSPVGAILFDHPDPSIFTVLTAPSGEEGTANIDFVIFPPRWLVAEAHVPAALVSPQHHERVHGPDPRPVRRQGGGLRAGRHQPAQHDAGAWTGRGRLRQGDHASELKPVKLEDTMAFMFETRFPQHADALCAPRLETLQDDYADCWAGLKKRFNGTPEGDWS